jgi:hypothetical protein
VRSVRPAHEAQRSSPIAPYGAELTAQDLKRRQRTVLMDGKHGVEDARCR